MFSLSGWGLQGSEGKAGVGPLGFEIGDRGEGGQAVAKRSLPEAGGRGFHGSGWSRGRGGGHSGPR